MVILLFHWHRFCVRQFSFPEKIFRLIDSLHLCFIWIPFHRNSVKSPRNKCNIDLYSSLCLQPQSLKPANLIKRSPYNYFFFFVADGEEGRGSWYITEVSGKISGRLFLKKSSFENIERLPGYIINTCNKCIPKS